MILPVIARACQPEGLGHHRATRCWHTAVGVSPGFSSAFWGERHRGHIDRIFERARMVSCLDTPGFGDTRRGLGKWRCRGRLPRGTAGGLEGMAGPEASRRGRRYPRDGRHRPPFCPALMPLPRQTPPHELIRQFRALGFEGPRGGGEASLHEERKTEGPCAQPPRGRHRGGSLEADLEAGRNFGGTMALRLTGPVETGRPSAAGVRR